MGKGGGQQAHQAAGIVAGRCGSGGSAAEMVLESTRAVVEVARHVRVDRARARALAEAAQEDFGTPPAWGGDVYFSDGTERTAQWLFVLDALNFSFWPDPGQRPWTVEWRGQQMRGAMALTAALHAAQLRDGRVSDARFLAAVDVPTLRQTLDGEGELPMLAERAAVLNQLGTTLLDRYGGSFAELLREANGSASRATLLIADAFPPFDDVQSYRGRPVYFYKKVQLLLSMLHGSYGGKGLGRFDDIASMTVYADYRLPQTLRKLGIIEYSPELAAKVDAELEIPADSEEEVEIRAASVWGAEEIRRALLAAGRPADTRAIDFWLWKAGRGGDGRSAPHHRTRTIWY